MSAAPEPESVKNLVARLQGAGNGENSDAGTVLRIYSDFRWAIKKASMVGEVTYKGIEAMIEAAIKRVQKQVKDPAVRDQAVLQFTQAKSRLSEWTEDEKLRQDICRTHQLPFFICGCGGKKENA